MSIFFALILLGSQAILAKEKVSKPIESLEFSVPSKPPFYHLEGKEVNGFIVSIVKCLFQANAIKPEFNLLPLKRILRKLQSDPDHCSIGWFRTKEREDFADFSKPIWQDRAALVLTQKEKKKLIQKKHPSFSSLIADSNFKMLRPAGVSYGQNVDDLIGKNSKNISTITGSFRQIIKMLAFNRADYTLVHPPEWYYYSKSINKQENLAAPHDVSIIAYKDLNKEIHRHIICNKKTQKNTIKRINILIDKRLSGCQQQIGKSYPWIQKL